MKDPKKQIPAYFERVMQTYVTMAIDLFIECEKLNRLDEFFNVLTRTAVCTEAKTEALSDFKLEVAPPEGIDGTMADHDQNTPLNTCIMREIDAIIKEKPELADSEDFADFAAEIKERLVGKVRPIEESYKTSRGIAFKSILDEENKPVVREVTAKDIDDIGQACLDVTNGMDM